VRTKILAKRANGKDYFLRRRAANIPAAPTRARTGVGHSGESTHPPWARATLADVSKMNAIKQSKVFTSRSFLFQSAGPADRLT